MTVKPKYINRLALAICLLATLQGTLLGTLLAGCDPQDTAETNKPTSKANEIVTSIKDGERSHLWLSAQTAQDGALEVSVNFSLEAGKSGPRVAEIFLRHSGNLKYESFKKGGAVLDAEKQLVVQPTKDGLRAVIFSSANLENLESGALVQYRFTKTDDSPATLEVMTEKPIFAPEEANHGLLVGDPVEVP